MVNEIGGAGSKKQVFVLNPENWVLRTKGTSCYAFGFYPFRSNCLWNLALNYVPADPPAA